MSSFFSSSRSGLGMSAGKFLLWRMVSARAMLGRKLRTALAVDADGGLFGADDIGQVEAVGFEERLAQKRSGELRGRRT